MNIEFRYGICVGLLIFVKLEVFFLLYIEIQIVLIVFYLR